MFCAAFDALANDPAVGLVAFDAFPPREEGEDVWAEPVLQTARRLRRETGVVFASVAMGPLGYGTIGKRFVAGGRLPFLQGHRAATGAIRALVELQGSRARDARTCRRTRTAARRSGSLRGLSGPLDEVRAARSSSCTGCAGRGAGRRDTRGRRGGRPRARVPGGGEGARARAAAQGEARGRPTRVHDPGDVEVVAAEVLRAARRPAPRSKVLVQQMATGTEVLVGAVVDEAVRGLHHDAAGRRARRGRRRGVRRGRPSPAPRRSRSSRAGFRLRARRRTARSPRPSRGPSRGRPRRARPPRPADVARGEPVARRRARRRRGGRVAETRHPA